VAVRTIEGWHREVEDVDVERSAYVVLTHDQGKVEYELFWFPPPSRLRRAGVGDPAAAPGRRTNSLLSPAFVTV
jgi:hypothetical protein